MPRLTYEQCKRLTLQLDREALDTLTSYIAGVKERTAQLKDATEALLRVRAVIARWQAEDEQDGSDFIAAVEACVRELDRVLGPTTWCKRCGKQLRDHTATATECWTCVEEAEGAVTNAAHEMRSE